MSTVQTWQINSTSSDETEQLGEKLGKHLRGQEVLELVSDLGGGKTTFVRGVARGVGSNDKVSSPTFTVSKVYKSRGLELHHFDLYRLGEAGLVEYELQELLDDPSVVIIVEWAHIANHVLPEDRLTIDIKPTSETQRQITFRYPDSLTYLVENL